MAENTQTTSTFANDTPTEFIRETLLERAAEDWVFPRYGTPVRLPANQGNTIQFVRYERLGLPGDTLSEGTTPDGQNLSVSKVTADVDQWGSYITESDVAILQTFHDIIEEGSKLLGEQWARINDREIQRTLMRGTNIRYAGDASSIPTLEADDVPDTNAIYGCLDRLRARGARPHTGDDYIVICDTANEIDMLKDPTFVATKGQMDATPLERGEFMRWAGCRFVRSNQIPSFALNTAFNGTWADISASSSTQLVNDDYFGVLVGVDEDGQEILTGAENSADIAGLSSDIVRVTTPAASLGVVKFNIYLGTATGAAKLQYRNALPSTAYDISLDGVAESGGDVGVTYSTSGVNAPAIPASGVVVHTMFFIGRGYYAVIENGPMTTHKTKLPTSGEATDSDPLNQRFKFGYKGIRKDAILNENFGLRMHCASSQTGYYYAA